MWGEGRGVAGGGGRGRGGLGRCRQAGRKCLFITGSEVTEIPWDIGRHGSALCAGSDLFSRHHEHSIAALKELRACSHLETGFSPTDGKD